MTLLKEHSSISLYGRVFLITGLLVQVVTYIIAPDSWLSLISGMLGICSVVLCAQGQILTFFFGFGQILTYTYICYTQRLYGLIGINAFYFLSQFYGLYVWRKRLVTTDNGAKSLVTGQVSPRSLSVKTMLLISGVIVLCSYLTGWGLTFSNDTQPYLDAFTTVPALVAQVMLILAYREQWYIWLFIDILYVVMWVRAGDWCLVAQHIFWCANCMYGLYNWKVSDNHLQL